MRRWGVALVLYGAGTAACSNDDSTAPPIAPEPASVVAIYDALERSELAPYPSNRYLVDDASQPSGKRLRIDATTSVDRIVTSFVSTAAQLSTLDGFSTAGGVVVTFTSGIDANGLDTLPEAVPPATAPLLDARRFAEPGSPFYLVDVTEGAPERGTALPLVPRVFETPADEYYTVAEHSLVVQPGAALLPAHDYVFAVTRELRAADGTPVGRSSLSHDLLEARLGDAYSASVLDALSVAEPAMGVGRSEIVLATRFTTAAPQRSLVATAAAHRAAPAPTADAWTVETPRAAPDRRVRFRARFAAPELRGVDGKWSIDDQGIAATQKSEQLEVFLAFSDSTASGPRPVVIFQHGLGGDKDGCWGTAGRLAELSARGAAVIAIDSPEHGARADAETDLVTSIYAFFGIQKGTTDFDIERARDNFRQMASDQLELVRLISTLGSLDLLPLAANGSPAPDGVPDLDVSRLQYIGHSFGGVQGPTIFALAPEIKQATWNVGGASLMTLLRDSATFRLVVNGLVPSGTPYGAVARFMAITQAIVDPGDAVNYGRYGAIEGLPGVPGWTARDLLLQEVVNDNVVPNSSSEVLARSAGMVVVGASRGVSGLDVATAPVTGNLPSGATAVISQFSRVEGGTKSADHGGLIFTPEARAQYVEFFRSGLAAPHATAPVP